MRPERRATPGHACWLWPGHDGKMPEDTWQPDSYPLKPEVAARFLKSLEILSCPELEAMRHGMASSNFTSAVKESEEIAALCEFVGRPRLRGAYGAALELAQQLLLWSWHQEKALGELAELERECLLREQAIPAQFLEAGEEKSLKPAPARPSVEISWRPVVANAAFFISPAQAILAEGQMSADLQENLEFHLEEQQEGWTDSDGILLKARAPLWQALGFSRPAGKEAASVYNHERIWLIWREE